MELRYFKCEKCEEYLAGQTDRQTIQCGALVGFTPDETPIGCGGLLVEVDQQEAIEAAYRKKEMR